MRPEVLPARAARLRDITPKQIVYRSKILKIGARSLTRVFAPCRGKTACRDNDDALAAFIAHKLEKQVRRIFC